MDEERRCPTCGALVSPDAEWCGQCYAPLAQAGGEAGAASAGDEPTRTPGGGRLEVAQGKAAWDCPVCETRNPIEASLCAVCGTPFTRLFREPERAPQIDPQSAVVWSLVLPGLGHWRAGRRPDGVARIALFLWTFGTLAVLLVSRFGKGGLGPTFPLFVLFLGASALVYVLSAVDAYRIASGAAPIVSSRTLLWGSAGLVVLSVLIASFVALPAIRR